ncbi:MAG: HXXEE domain-containing protein [Syntrophales bacterium]
MNFTEWQWLFPVAVTVHNLEEAVLLPAWSQRAGRWHRPVEPFAFRFAVAVLTVLAYAATAWSAAGGAESIGAYLLSGYALAMLLNVFLPHLLATVALRRYVPGLATALLCNLPVTAGLLQAAFAEGYVKLPTFAYYAVPVCLGLVASIPFLFAVGRRIKAGPGDGR